MEHYNYRMLSGASSKSGQLSGCPLNPPNPASDGILAMLRQTQMTWFLQIQDSEGNVLLMNQPLGSYKKYSKFVDNASLKFVNQYPNAKRWEVRAEPYTRKAVI
jgi:hypothetical protein